MNGNIWLITFADGVAIATTLIIASIGAIITERSGVINLGVEGYLLMGSVTSLLVGTSTGNLWLALLVASLVGAAMALVHAVLAVSLRANQIVSGLAMVIFATGLSQYLGKAVEGERRPVVITVLDLGPLADVPLLGPVLFRHDPFTYAAWALAIGASWYLHRTRPGLVLRATGDAPATVDAQGVSVVRVRYVHTLVGGTLMGFAGAWFMLARGTSWTQSSTTSGIGWIALALVVFASWRPWRALAGAVIFGFALRANFTLQAAGITAVPPEILSMLPYLLTIVVLVALAPTAVRRRAGAPSALGAPYVRDER